MHLSPGVLAQAVNKSRMSSVVKGRLVGSSFTRGNKIMQLNWLQLLVTKSHLLK